MRIYKSKILGGITFTSKIQKVSRINRNELELNDLESMIIKIFTYSGYSWFVWYVHLHCVGTRGLGGFGNADFEFFRSDESCMSHFYQDYVKLLSIPGFFRKNIIKKIISTK